MSYAQDERAGLVDTLREVGPDAPTLCEGWTTRDLAAHLITRERRPDAAVGMMVPALAGHTGKVQAGIADDDWDALLGKIASGPPLYSPFKPVDRWINLAEMFIHHEDIRRGGADPDGPWTPRTLTPGMEKALLKQVRSLARMSLRSLGARVELRTPNNKVIAQSGRGNLVVVTGPAGELLLFINGRFPTAVTVEGDPAAVASVRGSVHGL